MYNGTMNLSLDLGMPSINVHLDDKALIERLRELTLDERAVRAELVVLLAEFDQRRLYLTAGFPSLFAYLTDHLRFSKASAYRRVTAARLQARMPVVASYLREGRLSLTKLCHLRDVLEPDSCLAVLEQAATMSEAEVEELAVKLDPKKKATPAPRESIRPVAVLQIELPSVPPSTVPPPPPAPRMDPAPPPPAPPVVVRHQLKMTVGPDFLTLLDRVRDAMSHSHPGVSLEVLFAECMKTTLRAHEQRARAEVARPLASPRPSNENSRHVPAHVRRTVWKRDEGRCTFIADDGHRCGATRKLTLHHDHAYALGGLATVENLRLVCSGHNDLLARADFGDRHMNRFTRAPVPDRAAR